MQEKMTDKIPDQLSDHLSDRLSWLEDPQVFQVNRLDAHSDHVCFASLKEMEQGETSLRQFLDGSWRFQWSKAPDKRPADFWQEGYDDSGFGTIRVPGHIELQKFGQIQYINTLYPWDGHAELRPPKLDWEDNPVGSYVREFDLEPGLIGKRVCISFQGVEQAFYLWLNGHLIGYGEDSFTPSDFDLTPYIKERGNRLCVEVYKRSSAAWIEDQDFFRFSGIFRSVFLYGKPELHLEDLWLQPRLSKDNNGGRLKIRLGLSGQTEGAQVRCRVAHKKQGILFDGLLKLEQEKQTQIEDVLTRRDMGCPDKGQGVRTDGQNQAGSGCVYAWAQELEFPLVFLWSHETPELYQVTLAVMTADGQVTEAVPYQIGFRRFELKDGLMLLNGERLMIKGVNRHEWNPRHGRVIGREDMEAAMEVFRRNHINAVRTCHYPNQTVWYEMCDENGIYMMDETNMESHGSWQKLGVVEPSWNVPGSHEEWKACVLDRAKSMFERDKNHVSILFWSCGNESYAGEDILAMAEYFRKHDDSRLVHYEGVYHNRAYDRISDVESRMYAPPQEVREYLEGGAEKPFILCEYMHDMGNSLGGMESYIRLGEEFPQYQGGFIWDYMDQALWHKDPAGRTVLGYGGDFGERQTDYAFSGNGIVFADGTEKPAMQEVRYWYAGEEERKAQDEANRAGMEKAIGQIMRGNRGEDLAGAVKMTEKACVKALSESVAGNDGKKDLDMPARKDGRETVQGEGALRVAHGDGALGVRGRNFEILFSYPEGGPVSLKVFGAGAGQKKGEAAENNNGDMGMAAVHEWLWRVPRPAYWRAATENDLGCGFAVNSSVWAAADSWQKCEDIRIVEEGARVVSIRYTYTSPAVPDLRTEVTYTVRAEGSMTADVHYYGQEGRPQLPLFGLRFSTPEPVEATRWQGLSGETYPDRKKGGVFGWHEEQPHIPAYLVPQECGCHMDTVQAVFHKDGGQLSLEMCEEPFAFSAIPYTPAQLDQAAHREELPQPVRTVITVCGAMRGVGGIDSWLTDVEEAYHISGEKDIRFQVRFRWECVDGE